MQAWTCSLRQRVHGPQAGLRLRCDRQSQDQQYWSGNPVAENVTTYTANKLNLYTATASPAESFSYGLDGNLTGDGQGISQRPQQAAPLS